MIGQFACNKESAFWKSMFLTKDKDEAYSQYLLNKGSFINIRETQKKVGNKIIKEIFYQVFNESISINIETEKPIYDMVVDLEAIEL